MQRENTGAIEKLNAVDNPRRFMTFIYVASLSVIAALSIIAHLVLDNVVESQSQTGIIINKSGQQRMLSQRISLFTNEYLATGNIEAKETAEQLLVTMTSNHEYLLGPHNEALKSDKSTPLSPAIYDMYFAPPLQVDEQVKRFTQSVNEALNYPERYLSIPNYQANAEYAAMARNGFLSALNTVVKQYETESLDKVERLRLAQNVVLAVVILTIIIEAFYVFRPMVSKISQFANQLQYDANYDHLSGLYNRRAFYFSAEKLFKLGKRKQEDMSIVLMDIDKFKNINDTYGHDVGDEAIKHVAKIIQDSVRASDIVTRYGGEEFLVLLPSTSLSGAHLLAEKIRQNIEDSTLNHGDVSLKMTISGGASKLSMDDASVDDTIARADKRLYQAKDSGRNNIVSDEAMSA